MTHLAQYLSSGQIAAMAAAGQPVPELRVPSHVRSGIEHHGTFGRQWYVERLAIWLACRRRWHELRDVAVLVGDGFPADPSVADLLLSVLRGLRAKRRTA